MKSLATMLFLALLSASAAAEMEKFGNFEVNYNVITTDSLVPVIAKAYGIERSPRRGMLTVSVTEPSAGGVSRHIGAAVEVSIVNQFAQVMPLKMRSINEGKAIYYLGDFALAPPDYLRFSLSIGGPELGKTLKIDFQKNFLVQ